LPSGLTNYKIIIIIVIPPAILIGCADYFYRWFLQTDIYEDKLFELQNFKININVLTKQGDSVSGGINSIGSFLVLENTEGFCAIKWGDIERIYYLRKPNKRFKN
jgi:hypothetical protein